ncbi:hypothetical protein GEMRC1_002373 [Eukaryota sp. GEM-RC1]
MIWSNPRGKVFSNASECIGSTPMVDLHRYSAINECQGLICAKLEFLNPGLSVKDRIAKSMILSALEDGSLTKESVVIEATSGNTGIGLAMVCASLGIKCLLCMPESMSIERRKILDHLGADLVLTEAAAGMKGAIAKANELAATEYKHNAFIPKQFENPNNPRAHAESTAVEILTDLGSEIADVYAVVCGVGTGGSITGIGQVFKEDEKTKHIKLVAVEPVESHVLSGGKPGPHKIQGIGAGFTPAVLRTEFIDTIVQVSSEDAVTYSKMVAREEGILAGISSGAALKAAIEVAKAPEAKGKRVLCLLPSTSERYLSSILFE